MQKDDIFYEIFDRWFGSENYEGITKTELTEMLKIFNAEATTATEATQNQNDFDRLCWYFDF